MRGGFPEGVTEQKPEKINHCVAAKWQSQGLGDGGGAYCLEACRLAQRTHPFFLSFFLLSVEPASNILYTGLTRVFSGSVKHSNSQDFHRPQLTPI